MLHNVYYELIYIQLNDDYTRRIKMMDDIYNYQKRNFSVEIKKKKAFLLTMTFTTLVN